MNLKLVLSETLLDKYLHKIEEMEEERWPRICLIKISRNLKKKLKN